jgi:hypothetical protein
MKMEDDLFKITYEEDKNTLFFEGSLRLNDLARFEKIKQFMLDVYGLDTRQLVIDFLGLDFLNSAGISTLCNFIFEIKDQNKKSVTIIGNKNIQWQNKSFANLKIIWDKIEISFR